MKRALSIAVCAVFTTLPRLGAQPHVTASSVGTPFEIAPWVDHFDFALFFDTETEEGMGQILDHVAETGANVQFFRSSGNSIRHPSAFRKSFRTAIDKRKGVVGQRMIYGWADFNRAQPDLLEIAFRLGRERGMRPYIHWPFEECHAPGFYKAFMSWNMDHPQFWGRTSKGQPWLGRVSLCYPEVIDYKLAILDELLAHGAEGIFIDTFRAGMWGPWAEYVPTVTQAFEKRYGRSAPPDEKDSEWCEHVADYVTELFCRMRQHLDEYGAEHGRHVELLVGVAGIAPVRDLPGDGPMLYRAADWRAWVDMGLIDTLVMHSIDWDPERPFETYREYGRQVMEYVDGRCKVHWPVSAYSFRKKGLKHLAQITALSQAEVARKLVTIAWEEGAAGISMECVDYNNYRPDTREAIAELARTTCRFIKPWETRGTAPPVEMRRIRPRPTMAVRRKPSLVPVSGVKRLSAGPGNNTEAAWHPDGEHIVFQSDRNGEAEIYVLTLADGSVQRLDTGPGFSMFPAITPDGAYVVYAHGHLPRSAFQTVAVAQPGWHGRQSGKIDTDLKDRLSGINIWRVATEGGAPLQLTQGQHCEYLPTVSPDGTAVVFCSPAGAEAGLVNRLNSMFIQRVSADGGEREVLYKLGGAYAVQPSISPDGRYLCFSLLTSYRGTWRLMLSAMADPPFAVELTGMEMSAYAPRWSPDGEYIAFTGYTQGDDGWGIYVLSPAPDAAPVRVHTGFAESRNPVWSPDGRWLLFEASEDGRYQLFRMPVATIENLPSGGTGPEALIQSKPRYSSDVKDGALSRLFDGDTDSFWQIKGDNHWVEVSFGRAMTVAGLRLHHGMLAYYKNPSGESSVRGYCFQAWIENEWRDVFPPITDRPRYKGEGEDAFAISHVFPAVTASRFRLIVTGTNDTGRRVSSPDRVSVLPEDRVTYLRELDILDGNGQSLIR